jgi:hypothetical protein
MVTPSKNNISRSRFRAAVSPKPDISNTPLEDNREEVISRVENYGVTPLPYVPSNDSANGELFGCQRAGDNPERS